MDDPNDPADFVVCPHLLACHTIWYDNTNPDAGYSLGRVVVHLRPADGQGFPFRTPRLFLFAQLYGTPGEYVMRIRYLRVGVADDGEEWVAEVDQYGPWEIAIPGDNYVECFGLPLLNLSFPEQGVYEFQLWLDGFDEPLGRERIEARE